MVTTADKKYDKFTFDEIIRREYAEGGGFPPADEEPPDDPRGHSFRIPFPRWFQFFLVFNIGFWVGLWTMGYAPADKLMLWGWTLTGLQVLYTVVAVWRKWE